MRVILISTVSFIAVCALFLAGALFSSQYHPPAAWTSIYRLTAQDVGALGGLFMVVVVSLQSTIAFWEHRRGQRDERAAANDRVFRLHKLFLSVDYQEQVRVIAWYALWKARIAISYRQALVAALAGAEDTDAGMQVLDAQRHGKSITATEKSHLQFREEYHRVLDILGFFAALSVLQETADRQIVRLCHFSYDNWRVVLWRIVTDLGNYIQALRSSGSPIARLATDRHRNFEVTLRRLDAVFGLTQLDVRDDPCFTNDPPDQLV